LFSRADVALVVNRNFEPVWESVRPVPLVHIDFGNGTVLTRTLHGNIATYVCDAAGRVLDVLPGIYEPIAYMDRLNQLRLLGMYVNQQPPPKREVCLTDYHRQQRDALSHNQAPPSLVAMKNAGVSKERIDNDVIVVLMPGSGRQEPAPSKARARARRPAVLTSPEDLASWDLLAEDTRLNETTRRYRVHALLAARGLVRPEAVSKRIYKEVLHTDLDDPYLGLGSVLFANYPFKDHGVH
jgi:hypothetical protein